MSKLPQYMVFSTLLNYFYDDGDVDVKGLNSTVVACSLQVRGVAGSNTGMSN